MATTGTVSALFIELGIAIGKMAKEQSEVDLTAIFTTLIDICRHMELSLVAIIRQKMCLNSLKYPVEPERKPELQTTREIAKYRVAHTRMFDTQSLHNFSCHGLDSFRSFWGSFEELQEMVDSFARQRDWLPKYTRNKVLISLFTELGELTSLVEWTKPNLAVLDDTTILNNIASELADVGIYTFHMARITGYSFPLLAGEVALRQETSDSKLMPAFAP